MGNALPYSGFFENPVVNDPAADDCIRPLFECLLFDVIPASKARRESFRKDSGQAGMTEIWNMEKTAGLIIIKHRNIDNYP